jgi:signal transduction histidine kinase
VRLRRSGDRVCLRVEDQGVGFDAARILESEEEDRGFGLSGMRNRVRLFAGRFAIRSSPEAGTTIEVEVPLGREGGG